MTGNSECRFLVRRSTEVVDMFERSRYRESKECLESDRIEGANDNHAGCSNALLNST